MRREQSTWDVRDYLKNVSEMMHGKGCEAFVLANGRSFTPAKRPASMRKMRNKRCFSNALHHAGGELIYCEGWAAGIIPCAPRVAMHARRRRR